MAETDRKMTLSIAGGSGMDAGLVLLCGHMHFLKYESGWRLKRMPEYFAFGILFHAASFKGSIDIFESSWEAGRLYNKDEDDDEDRPGRRDEAGEDGEGEEGEPPAPTNAPPEFQGSRGRRRSMEGPRILQLNYKDVTTLSHFITEQGKILPKRTTKVPAGFQRKLGAAIKRARYLALLPYTRRRDG